VFAAVLYDPDVFRGVMELVTCLAPPNEVFSRPGFIEKVDACRDKEAFTFPGPDREHLIAFLSE
jgi:hypothetical protein